MRSTTIRVEDLVKTYDKTPFRRRLANMLGLKRLSSEKVRALSGISFKVSEGEVFGFLGPNGAGKTTTVKMGMETVAVYYVNLVHSVSNSIIEGFI